MFGLLLLLSILVRLDERCTKFTRENKVLRGNFACSRRVSTLSVLEKMSVAASRITGLRPSGVSVAGSVLTAATIKCCLCGLEITGMQSMCLSCLAKETDVTANLSKQEDLVQCRECGKW